MTMNWLHAVRRSRALLLSLALNVLLVSAIGVHFLHDVAAGNRDRSRNFVERLAERLPAQDAGKLRATYEQRGKELTEMRSRVRSLYDDYRAALRAEPFDRASLDRAVDQLVKARTEMHRAFARMIVEAAADMSPEGRVALAERRRRR